VDAYWRSQSEEGEAVTDKRCIRCVYYGVSFKRKKLCEDCKYENDWQRYTPLGVAHIEHERKDEKL